MSEVNIRKHATGGNVYKGITDEDKNKKTSNPTDPKATNDDVATPETPVVTTTTKPDVEVKTATSAPTTNTTPTTTTPVNTDPATSSKATTEFQKTVLPGAGRKYKLTVNGEQFEIDDYKMDSYFSQYYNSAKGVIGKAESELS